MDSTQSPKAHTPAEVPAPAGDKSLPLAVSAAPSPGLRLSDADMAQRLPRETGPGQAGFGPETAPPQAESIGTKEAAILDPAALKELRLMANGDTAFVARLTRIFLNSAAQHFADLRRAVDQHDAPGLTRAAHSLKSNSRQFGALALARLCRDLEVQGQAGQFEGAAEKIAQAEDAYQLVRAALQQML